MNDPNRLESPIIWNVEAVVGLGSSAFRKYICRQPYPHHGVLQNEVRMIPQRKRTRPRSAYMLHITISDETLIRWNSYQVHLQ